MKREKNTLQLLLDQLHKDCKDSGFKITGKNISKIKPKVNQLVLSISGTYYDRYVGEVGWLYTDIEGDTKLSKDFVEAIQVKDPEFITISDDEVFFNGFEEPDLEMEVDYRLDDKKLVFKRCEVSREPVWNLDLVASGIKLEEDEGCFGDLSCTIQWTTKYKAVKETEYRD